MLLLPDLLMGMACPALRGNPLALFMSFCVENL